MILYKRINAVSERELQKYGKKITGIVLCRGFCNNTHFKKLTLWTESHPNTGQCK
jgi:hypothetical protein